MAATFALFIEDHWTPFACTKCKLEPRWKHSWYGFHILVLQVSSDWTCRSRRFECPTSGRCAAHSTWISIDNGTNKYRMIHSSAIGTDDISKKKHQEERSLWLVTLVTRTVKRLTIFLDNSVDEWTGFAMLLLLVTTWELSRFFWPRSSDKKVAM